MPRTISYDSRRSYQPVIEPSQTREELRAEARQLELVLAIRDVAKTHRILTADDVWHHLGQTPTGEDSTHMGNAFQIARDAGFIRPTGQFLRSRRPAAKGHLMGVWQSQVV